MSIHLFRGMRCFFKHKTLHKERVHSSQFVKKFYLSANLIAIVKRLMSTLYHRGNITWSVFSVHTYTHWSKYKIISIFIPFFLFLSALLTLTNKKWGRLHSSSQPPPPSFSYKSDPLPHLLRSAGDVTHHV